MLTLAIAHQLHPYILYLTHSLPMPLPILLSALHRNAAHISPSPDTLPSLLPGRPPARTLCCLPSLPSAPPSGTCHYGGVLMPTRHPVISARCQLAVSPHHSFHTTHSTPLIPHHTFHTTQSLAASALAEPLTHAHKLLITCVCASPLA
jgi:hypothetical protein